MSVEIMAPAFCHLLFLTAPTPPSCLLGRPAGKRVRQQGELTMPDPNAINVLYNQDFMEDPFPYFQEGL
jgi:hypothetical protein